MTKVITDTRSILEVTRELHQEFVEWHMEDATGLKLVEYVQMTGRYFSILKICKHADVRDRAVAELMTSIDGMLSKPDSIYSMLEACVKVEPIQGSHTFDTISARMHMTSVVTYFQGILHNLKSMQALFAKAAA